MAGRDDGSGRGASTALRAQMASRRPALLGSTHDCLQGSFLAGLRFSHQWRRVPDNRSVLHSTTPYLPEHEEEAQLLYHLAFQAQEGAAFRDREPAPAL